MAFSEGNIEVCPWLKSMPIAPEYHPTLAEFQDPIGYIFKIEKEASKYGICKIVPPFAEASRKTVIANLNKSLLARAPESGPTFTTRQQQVGFCPRKHRPVRKPVWQSGERYTVSEFEAKAKNFERSYLKKYVKKTLNALEMETLYWNATVDKPFSVEYANDMPGSAFVVKKNGGKKNEAASVADTEWNMRGVSRANVSLLKFMKEEIPGVTSPMVYVAMMFSWFAWHVEDHDLHSLNYLHMGAGKTWYGVPRDAAVAFEEVIREHGYGGEINPLVTFSTLGEKTTVMSPEVLISAGVPCCRLVQNAGDFVVTFPRAYHSGFSHGFNCGEAANIATPEWLKNAKEAAIQRASINCPPMVSHFQLLYDLALSLCSRVPKNNITEPRSSRLKDKNKSEGEMLIKELFFQDIIQNNNTLHTLGKGSSIVLLSNSSFHSKSKLFPSLRGLDLELTTTKYNAREEFMLEKKRGIKRARDFAFSGKVSVCTGNNAEQMDSDVKKASSKCEQGLFSCVTCGILCFACVAIVKPTEAATRYLMSADCNVFNDDWGVSGDEDNYVRDRNDANTNNFPAPVNRKEQDGFFNVPIYFAEEARTFGECSSGMISNNDKASEDPSSLVLLALAYGNNSSDSEDDEAEAEAEAEADISVRGCSEGEDLDSISIFASSSFDYSDKFRTTNDCGESKSENNTSTMSLSSRSDEDSSRLHVFCLEHAMQVEKCLRSIGGACVVLVCHPDYPKLESEARKVAEELESDRQWSEISFRDATEEDENMIQLALESENAIHGYRDWAVRLGINLFYSANLSRSPLYCKQMPYNPVMYSAFGRSLYSQNVESEGKVISRRQKKIVVAGKWCGKVWMSNQVHPLLINKASEKQELDFGTVNEIKPRLMHERPLLETTNRESITSCTTSRKRKSTAQNGSVLKGKILESEELDNEYYRDFSVSNCRNKGIKRKRGFKPLKKDIPLDESSEEELQINAKNLESFEEFPLTNYWKQISCKNRGRRMENEILETKRLDESSEESSLSNSCKRIKDRRGTKESSEESPPRNSSKKININKNQARRTKKEITKNEYEDESSEEFQLSKKSCKRIMSGGCGIQNLKNLEESTEEFPLYNSWKLTKSKRMKKTTPNPQEKQTRTKKPIVLLIETELEGGPSTRLRKRMKKLSKSPESKSAKAKPVRKDVTTKKMKVSANSNKTKFIDEEMEYLCDMEGCTMSFGTKQELTMHKRNICSVKGCGKKFFSHKYLLQHRRVHVDDRPLKCPWKGCKMTFKWAWARTEHIRVHTGARPYVCTQSGCGQTFRFVSDFSRHKRKTGHSPKKSRG